MVGRSDAEQRQQPGVGNPHEHNINRAAEAGLTGGRPDGTYKPQAAVTRAQMASFVARVLDLLVDDGHTDLPAAPSP